MSRRLQPCPSCAQHLRADEIRCPFCDAPLPAGFGALAPARGAIGRPMSRAALLFFGATATAACGGRTLATAPADGGGEAASSEGGGGAEYGGPREATTDASTDAPSETAEPQGQTFWNTPPPPPGAATVAAAYGPASVDPMPVSHYGPATVDPNPAAMYGPAVNYGPAVIAEPPPIDDKQ